MHLNCKPIADVSSSLYQQAIKVANENFQLEIVGRREGFVSSKQLLEEGRSEDLVFRFKPYSSDETKIFILLLWHLEDEILSYLAVEAIEKELSRRRLTIKEGRTEFLPYLVSKQSAVKQFLEDFEGRGRKVFGFLMKKNQGKKTVGPSLFIKIKSKNKKKVQRYSGWCRSHKTGTPANKNPGENLVREINLQWKRRKYIYDLLFNLNTELDSQLFLAGFNDNYEQITPLLRYKAKLEDELKTLSIE